MGQNKPFIHSGSLGLKCPWQEVLRPLAYAVRFEPALYQRFLQSPFSAGYIHGGPVPFDVWLMRQQGDAQPGEDIDNLLLLIEFVAQLRGPPPQLP